MTRRSLTAVLTILRFGPTAPSASTARGMGRLGLGVIVPFGRGRRWNVEVGYNKWVWGRSARRYQEPYFSLGRAF